jgi:hypothetical protein
VWLRADLDLLRLLLKAPVVMQRLPNFHTVYHWTVYPITIKKSLAASSPLEGR